MDNSEENPSNELIKGGVALIKTAYDDALKPASKEAGKALETMVKTVNVALSPLRGLVWGWDKIEDYLKQAIEKRLTEPKVPPDRVTTPNPDIAVPAIEALRYSKLRENYANLLSTAMDSDTAESAHPAFIEVLKQLTTDEAKILTIISKSYDPSGAFMLEPITKGALYPGKIIDCPAWESLCQKAGIFDLGLIGVYYTNLLRLGIITEAFTGKTAIPNFGNTHLSEDEDDVWGNNFDYANMRYLSLTSFGLLFMEACVKEPEDIKRDNHE